MATALRLLWTLVWLVVVTSVQSHYNDVLKMTVKSQDDHSVHKTRVKRQQSFGANDLIGLLSNLASQSGAGGGGGGFGGGGLGGIGANLLQQLQQQQTPQSDAGQPGVLGGLASGLAQFLAGVRGQDPLQGQQAGPHIPQNGPFGIYANQGLNQGGGFGQNQGAGFGQQPYPGQQQQPYPGQQYPGQQGQGQFGGFPGGQQRPYPGRPYPEQFPGRPGGNQGFGQFPGGQGLYPGAGGYAPNPAGAASLTQALTSIAQYDDLRCVPRLLCEVASGGRPDYSANQNSVVPFLSKDTLLTLLTVFNFADSSPLFAFGRAALLGITSRGSPQSCYSAYPTCPQDPDILVNYLNNHNGGFFRFFNNHQQQQQQHQQYAPQYLQQYDQQGQRPQQYNPQRPKGQQYYDQQFNRPLKGNKFGLHQGQGQQNYNKYNAQSQGANSQKYGLQQQQDQQSAQQYYGQQYGQYAQQYPQGGYGQQRIQNGQSATNQIAVTAKPFKQLTTEYEHFPPYAERFSSTTPRYESLDSQYDHVGESGRPKGKPLRFPRAEDGSYAESRIVYDGDSGVDVVSHTRKAKGFSFPGSDGSFQEQRKLIPMVFPDRTGTGDLRLETDDFGKMVIFSVSDDGLKVGRFKTAEELYGKGKVFKFPSDGFRKQRDSKSLMKFPASGSSYDREVKWGKKTVRFPDKYDEAYYRSAKIAGHAGEIMAEDFEETKGEA